MATQKSTVVAFPSALLRTLARVRDELQSYAKEYFVGKHGSPVIAIFQNLYELIAALTECQEPKAVEAILDRLVNKLAKLYDVLSANPFGNPSEAELAALGQELDALRKLSTDMTGLKDQRDKLSRALSLSEGQRSLAQGELITLQEQLASANKRLAELEARPDVKAVINQMASLKDLVSARSASLDRLTSALEAVTTGVAESKMGAGVEEDSLKQVLLALTTITKTIAVVGKDQEEKPLGDLEKEIKARKAWLAEISDRIQDVDGLSATLESELAEISQQARFGSVSPGEHDQISGKLEALRIKVETLTSCRAELLEAEDQVKSELKELSDFERALAKVKRPPEAIGKRLPSLPTLPPDLFPKSNENSEETGTRQDRLVWIGNEHGLSPQDVLIATLYELVEDRGTRSIMTIMATAMGGGLLDAFGWPQMSDILRDWKFIPGKKGLNQFLSHPGNMANGTPRYQRTAQSLPWKVSDILNDGEVQRFKATMKYRRD